MATALGPQSPNFSTTRPPTAPDVSAGVDTWCKDCSAPGATDGTILDASFFNAIIAQLRTAIVEAGITLSNADDNMLEKAIRALAVDELSANYGVRLDGSNIELTIGQGILPVMTAA